MSRTFLVAGLVLVLALNPLVVAAAEDPRFETYVPEPTLQPGETTQVEVQLRNVAEDHDDSVETAHDVRATMQANGTPFTVHSGVRLLGDLEDGDLTTSRFSISVPRDVDAGTYRIPINLTYRPAGEDERESTIVFADVRVDDYARFEVVSADTDAQVGDTGTVTVELRNVGSANATGATVELQSRNPDITFGNAASASRYVGDVAPDETVTVQYRARVSPDADVRSYSLAATVEFDDEDGVPQQSARLRVGVTPLAEQSFSLSNVQSTLRVGEEGTITATVTNEGPGAVRDAVVTIDRNGMNINRLESEYAVGTLAAGESATVEFPLEVTTSAEPGPKQFSIQVDYLNSEGEERESDDMRAQVDVEPERDRFTLDPVAATVEAGSGGELVVAITNNGETPVRNVNAKLFTDAPISASDDEAFVTELGPGETAEMTFGVGAAGGALEKAYPVNLDFQYDLDGDTKLSKTYTVAVDVTTPADSGGLPLPYIAGGVVVVLAIIGYVLFRR